MNRAGATVLLCMMGLSLAGCGSSMRSYLEKDTPAEALNARQDLTMPPDLRLPQPGTTTAPPDPGAASAPATQTASLATPPATPAYAAPKAAAPAVAAGDPKDAIYTAAGISVYNPDGTRKTDQQLREELQNYYIAQKKAKNPNYGTFMNIGNIFKDE
ncbi:MAG: hypothetical protein IOC82_01520 [Aestuariivirga sp.]|uniref:hypothetical protein n=1 Tax=Aestuariivirga sp. TaxID=2650926 RepID=UPI0025C6CB90|nr:hypothetical protein [Aestuariivirga sp.]MCA3559692.1 hypothetical protein [Aestuariivirga sp.]